MTEKGLSKKVALEGMSRGGLIIYNWAIANPDKVAAMEDALRYQKSFWKYMGIFMILMMVLYGLVIVAAILIPLIASM